MNIALNAVASLTRLADDFCGTPVPGKPPIPPGPLGQLGSLLSNVADAVSLNPQPLPPGESGGGMAKASWEDGELCPRLPFPPIPPHWGNVLNQLGGGL